MSTNNGFAPFHTTSPSPRILGICASLRAGRWAAGGDELVEQIRAITTEEDLKAFLKEESLAHLANFVAAGRDEGVPFDEMYRRLKKEVGRKGLSNSEVALAASLWSAKELGCDIDFVSLLEHFPPSGKAQKIEQLKDRLRGADGIILATPVYFGDRSSLAHDLMRTIQADPELAEALRGRVYVGVAIGAKRNGGQETTLIYHIVDMVNAGLLAVGNDSDTTSQYGGTVHAGDVGTAWKDDYGINTSMGAGRRIARVTRLLRASEGFELNDKLRVAFWLLQDRDGYARAQIDKLVAPHADRIEAVIYDIAHEEITRCLACDICPTHVDVDSEYRCIIQKKGDFFKRAHESLLEADAIVPVGFTSRDHRGIASQYQQFIERTRYLRRGDYVFTDQVAAPLIFEEVGANDSLQIRMLTSVLRHHTILTRPVLGHLHHGTLLNADELQSDWASFLAHAQRVTVGRLVNALNDETVAKYNPVGYILSAEKDKEDQKLNRRRAATEDRNRRAHEEAAARLAQPAVAGGSM